MIRRWSDRRLMLLAVTAASSCAQSNPSALQRNDAGAEFGGSTSKGSGSTRPSAGGHPSATVPGELSSGGSHFNGGAPATESSLGSGSTSLGGSNRGDTSPTGGTNPTPSSVHAVDPGGTSATGGLPSTQDTGTSSLEGGASQEGCEFSVEVRTSTAIPTVGILDWSIDRNDLVDGHAAFELESAAQGLLNVAGEAPIDVSAESHRTLLLGLKPKRTYRVKLVMHLSDGSTCTSTDYTLTTGDLPSARPLTTALANAAQLATGFVITSDMISPAGAYFFEVDRDGVWWFAAPKDCSRALLSHDGSAMWMMSLNVNNNGGEMRRVSMDGLDVQTDVSGLSAAHHDFTVLPGGGVAAIAWSAAGTDVPSDLIERDADGAVRAVARLDSEFYQPGPIMGGGRLGYHANSVQYHPSDDSYTVGDRNPNLFIKLTRLGQLVWQFGGSCDNAPAPACTPGTWTINHGHDLLSDGRFVFFNNAVSPARVFEYDLSVANGVMDARQLFNYAPAAKYSSRTLGDVQRLPNGNTLVTYSQQGVIEQLDASWNLAATFSTSATGYARWRPSLYGPAN